MMQMAKTDKTFTDSKSYYISLTYEHKAYYQAICYNEHQKKL